MEHKLQLSRKLSNGDILVVRGDDIDELAQNWHSLVGFYGGLSEVEEPRPAQQSNGETPNTTGELYIDVESIEFAGKGRWVVKGGWASKFGITCWPEVLEEAGLKDGLDPEAENKPTKQWRAYYIEKRGDDDKVRADKVVKLEVVG